MTYRAVFKREPDGRWTVEIPKVKGCHSCGRTIGQARDRIREALALFVDNAETAKIEEDIRLPPAAKGAVRGNASTRLGGSRRRPASWSRTFGLGVNNQ